MKTLLAVSLLLLSAAIGAAQTPVKLVDHLNKAVVLLYQQTEDGGQRMLCTGTAYRVIDKGYRFVTASHCVEGDTTAEEQENKFFITLDANGSKTFIPAKLIEAGDRQAGDDFAILEVTTEAKFDVIPLGDYSKVSLGENVANISSPLGLGKQYFTGFVSSLALDRPKLDAGDVTWHDVALVKIGGGPGSSGSSIVSVEQGAIIGILVGEFTHGELGHIVLPVSQFKAFEEKVDAKSYKKRPPKMKLLLNLFG